MGFGDVMKHNPLITVLMSVYNGGKFFETFDFDVGGDIKGD